MSIEQNLKIMRSENISTPIYFKCENVYRSKVCVQEFWYIVSGLDNQPEQSENDNPACKQEVPTSRLRDTLPLIQQVI